MICSVESLDCRGNWVCNSFPFSCICLSCFYSLIVLTLCLSDFGNKGIISISNVVVGEERFNESR